MDRACMRLPGSAACAFQDPNTAAAVGVMLTLGLLAIALLTQFLIRPIQRALGRRYEPAVFSKYTVGMKLAQGRLWWSGKGDKSTPPKKLQYEV